MSKCDIRPEIEYHNRIFQMLKCDIRPQFECQKRNFECQNAIFGPNSNDKIGFRMSKFDIRLQFECKNRISNVKM